MLPKYFRGRLLAKRKVHLIRVKQDLKSPALEQNADNYCSYKTFFKRLEILEEKRLFLHIQGLRNRREYRTQI